MNDSGQRAIQAIVPDDIEVWLSERPRWLQTAAKQMIDRKTFPTDEEIALLAQLCRSEAGHDKDVLFETVEPGALAQAAVRPPLRLNKIHKVQGVAAIKNGADLDFGSHNLTVIYGPNGTGKTGFSRLLKQVCGAKAKDDLYSNVFEDDAPPSAASIHVSVDGNPRDIDWTLKGGSIGLLKNVHVFDSKSASMYVCEKNEATYEPSRMRFISSLIKICDKVARCLNGEKEKLIKRLPQYPAEFGETPAAKWLSKIASGLPLVDIEKNCTFTEEQQAERIAMESSLAQKDIVGRLNEIARERANVIRVQQYLSGIKEKLSDSSVNRIIEARISATSKRKAADEDAKKVFAEAHLEGIGNASWKLLWEQARKFSTSFPYTGLPYPNVSDDARCVLCNQTLDIEAKERLKHFEAFVQEGLEVAANAAEKYLADLTKLLPILPSVEDWQVQTAVLKLPPETNLEIYSALVNRRVSADRVIDSKDVACVDWSPCEVALSASLEALAAEEKALQALQQDGKRKELIARVTELRAMEWLTQSKQSIIDEVERLNAVASLDKAVSLSNTIGLTKKNNELAKSELSAGYQARFAEELKKLGGDRLRVFPECKQQGKGKTTFGLTLRDIKKPVAADRILSEGELRIVAMAAFVADITGSNHVTPFIFDDPISSLDQDFEERVVKRLISLAESRQVIIFTHRLSLLALVDGEIKSIKEAATLAKTEPKVQLHVETLRRMGNVAGLRVQFSVRDSKPKDAIKKFQTTYIPELKRLLEALDEKYEHYAKGVCSDFRILVERAVESVLLNEVVLRFRRGVQTQGRLSSLAKIEMNDCNLIDDLMTRYSVFEHSQSDEFPAAVPDLGQMEADVAKLADWIQEFSKRTVVGGAAS
jgi:ABC-type hemin transport system ATPase subunit